MIGRNFFEYRTGDSFEILTVLISYIVPIKTHALFLVDISDGLLPVPMNQTTRVTYSYF